MRNKSLIAGLAIIITGISIYQLYFTLKGRGVEKNIIEPKAEQAVQAALADNPELTQTAQDSIYKNTLKLVKDSLKDEVVGIGGATYADVKRKELNLGLDLQGGIHATLIVSPEGIIKALAGKNAKDPFLVSVIDATQEAQLNDSRKFTEIFYDKYLELGGKEGALNKIFFSKANKGIISINSTDEEVLKQIDKELDEAIDRSIVILRSRIDKFGATQPVIHAVKSTGRIEIELPGADERERIEKQLSSVANLEFLDVVDGQEAVRILQGIQYALADIETKRLQTTTPEDAGEQLIEPDSTEEESLLIDGEENDATDDPLVENGDGLDSATQAAQSQEISQLLGQYLKIEPRSSRNPEYPHYSIYSNKRYYTRMSIYLQRPEIQRLLPEGVEILWGQDQLSNQTGEPTGFRELHLVKRNKKGEPLLSGAVVIDAEAGTDPMGQVYVSMSMNPEGTKRWANVSSDYTGNGHRVAIILDDVVFSAPGFNSEILGGQSQITGFATLEEAKDLASILKAGRLPAPTIIERIVSVGPSLGQQAIDQGLLSLAAGLIIVVLFMIAYYNKGGLIANIALLFNLFFILGILSTPSIGAALTLPGMAGIVLTIGMSIDANVLVFERIREEMRLGKPVKAAIDSGYARAFWTIFDANVTTLIAATILYVLGDGLVKGFAITLIIGIFCSFFSAVYITRLIVEFMTRNKESANISFTTGLSKSLFQNLSLDFIGKRKVAYLGSGILILVGVIIMFTNGLNLGVAFEGGRSYVVKFDDPISASEVKSQLKTVFGDAGVETKLYDTDDQLSITTTYMVEKSGLEADSTVEATLMKGLSNYNNPEIVQTIIVGPTIADDIIQSSIVSIILALIAVFIYILVRFRKWQFGLGALFALFHDVLVVLSVFAIVGLFGISFEIDEVFIAAVLTIVGYSINDTVVVFDRVKEGLARVSTKESLAEVLNRALNGTLSRTLMTSVTTLIVVIVLLTVGGEALSGFSFALLVGVLVGTYSSVFVATPIVLDTTNEEALKEMKED